MKKVIAGACAALSLSAGLTLAGDGCQGGVTCVPPESMTPVTIYRLPAAPPPVCAAPVPMMAGALFRREPLPPVCLPPQPAKQGRLFRGEPQPISCFRPEPVQITAFRKEPVPPRFTTVEPPTPITVFQAVPPAPPRCVAPETIPPISVYGQHSPGCMPCPTCHDTVPIR